MLDLHILPGSGGDEAGPPRRNVVREVNLESDEAYFRRRSQEERASADKAVDAHIQSLHLDLSARYAQMAAAIKEAADKIGH